MPLPIARCGAKTKYGTPCARRPIRRTGRCRLHGGKSTGPRTAQGKARCAAATRERWARYRAAKAALAAALAAPSPRARARTDHRV